MSLYIFFFWLIWTIWLSPFLKIHIMSVTYVQLHLFEGLRYDRTNGSIWVTRSMKYVNTAISKWLSQLNMAQEIRRTKRERNMPYSYQLGKKNTNQFYWILFFPIFGFFYNWCLQSLRWWHALWLFFWFLCFKNFDRSRSTFRGLLC